MRNFLVLSFLILASGAEVIGADRFALKGKAIACIEGEEVVSPSPTLAADNTIRGVLFKFHEDSVEVFTDWEKGFVKSRVSTAYKETGRHFIWHEDAYVPLSERLDGKADRQLRKHTLNRFAWMGTYAHPHPNGVSWIDAGEQLFCRVLSQVEADEKMMELKAQAGG